MNLKKTAIATAIATTITVPTFASADIIEMTFTGAFTLVSSTGSINRNSDASVPGVTDGSTGFDLFGSRTPISGTLAYDTTTGTLASGYSSISTNRTNQFSFFANGAASFTSLSFQAIGDGMGDTTGTLMAMTMGLNWNIALSIPVTIILDAAGFFNSIGTPGTTWTVQTGCTECATSATPDTIFGSAVGAVPMAMTTLDTAGTTLGSIFPLSNDGIVGSPMTTAPFPGQNIAFDFTTINATNVSSIPIPAAVWLFTSGLIGLTGIARRSKR